MLLYVMYENAMSILKLGASLEGLLGLKGSMTWTVTQKLGAQGAQGFDLQKMLKKIEIFFRELVVGFFLIGSAVYGYYVGASWVFTVYFMTQGVIFLIFALSLVEAVNLQPPSEAQLLGLVDPNKSQQQDIELQPVVPPPSTAAERKRAKEKERRRKKAAAAKKKRSQGAQYQGVGEEEEEEEEDDDDDDAEEIGLTNGASVRRAPQQAKPSLLRVLRANVIIFMYTLPINAFSILLLYGVTTMLLSELINTQWDDLIALSLALFIIPLHMFWALGNPTANWKHRKLARARRLPLSIKLKHFVQLQLLYFYLFLLFLISMYSCSATLQDYVSREVYHMTGKWLEEFIDRRLQEVDPSLGTDGSSPTLGQGLLALPRMSGALVRQFALSFSR